MLNARQHWSPVAPLLSFCPLCVPVCLPVCLQLALLSNLRSLDLSCPTYVATSQGDLVHLSQLRHLTLARPGLPACLGQLTQLETLQMENGAYTAHHLALLDDALPKLQHLTCLLLFSEGDELQSFPPGLAQLPRLQRCLLSIADTSANYRLPPSGPWLGSLRWLGLPWAAALEGLAVLAAARRLEYCCLMGGSGPGADAAAADSERWAAFWRWAATHPSLRCLGVELSHFLVQVPSSRFFVSLFDAVVDLQRRRPALRVHRTAQGAAPDFWTEVLTLSDIPA